ncbi:MAG: prepilin-type N-terminal cleavage/methylation domain-containing protein [Planctomycetes bacterium]|nr:prepilin-type N-terminal cleavage/methylation domain-containing protein [Planctomycetota bacterium]
MTRAPRQGFERGFTLLELAVALVLLALVIGNVYTVLGGTTRDVGARSAEFEAEAQARRALDRIAMALVGSYERTLFEGAESPDSRPLINYEEFLGMGDPDGDGVPQEVFSPLMRIALTAQSGGEVTWYESPGEAGERRVVWVKDVPQFAQGEIPGNGVDDNGNGLVDESGLAFVKEGRSVRILLSVRRSNGQGGWIEKQLQTVVTCRN